VQSLSDSGAWSPTAAWAACTRRSTCRRAATSRSRCCNPDVARDSIAVERFKREFDVSKLLPHLHIVEVLDFQPTSDGTFVLAMEFL